MKQSVARGVAESAKQLLYIQYKIQGARRLCRALPENKNNRRALMSFLVTGNAPKAYEAYEAFCTSFALLFANYQQRVRYIIPTAGEQDQSTLTNENEGTIPP